jgi:murein DD-endopeptidase MepM/ murein hydrolase activator NlpD
MAQSKPKLSSFLGLNNIVNFSRSRSTIRKTQTSYNEFVKFMNAETKALESIKLPKKRKIEELSGLNLGPVFGNAGNLLGGLVNGALDVGGFLGNFFGGGKKLPKKPLKAPGPNPKISGSKLKLGGFKALGIANAIFAGLDFTTGLAEGESVGKSAAGTGGALAGSLLGGVIGQALIPVPGLGFVVGSMAGNFLGGFAADRAYDAATGEKSVEQKTKERLKAQEAKQKLSAAAVGTKTLPEVMDKFDSVVTQFERLSQSIASGSFEGSAASKEWSQGEMEKDRVDYRAPDAKEFTTTGTGEEVFPLVGGRPTFTPNVGSFNASRDGGKRRHSAQDIGVDPNTPVVASRSGIVLQSYSTGYGAVGGAVVIKYDNGQQGLYGHTTPNVKVGDKVKAGQTIAKVTPDGGNTHLHYMRKDTRGNYIDPLPYLQSSKSGVPTVKPKKEESKKDLQKQSQFPQDSGDMSQKEKQQSTAAPKTSLMNNTVPNTQQLTPTQTKAAEQARVSGQQMNLSSQEIEKLVSQSITNSASSEVMPSSVKDRQTVAPQQIAYYPSYNQPQTAQSVIMPIMLGGSGPAQVSSSGGGGGSGGGGNQPPMIIPASQGKMLNSLFSTILLTSLSST